jgi:anti-sigma factor RsiW
MDCERVRSLIDAYTTNELDLAAALDVEDHLGKCAACAGELESFRALRRAVAGPSLRYAAPPELRRRISAELERLDRAQDPAPAAPAPRRRAGRFALAAAVGALLLLPWIATYRIASRSAADQLAAETTSSHIRSLMSDHLLDVVSTDQHTVKPWFNGRLDFSPAVVDLTAEGYPLIGGRLDYVNNRTVAAIVYRRRKHVINLYTWPAPQADSRPSASEHNGYHVLTWNHNGMSCVAVSDLNPQELRHFADLLRHEPTTRP